MVTAHLLRALATIGERARRPELRRLLQQQADRVAHNADAIDDELDVTAIRDLHRRSRGGGADRFGARS
jgi:hypothetical protein